MFHFTYFWFQSNRNMKVFSIYLKLFIFYFFLFVSHFYCLLFFWQNLKPKINTDSKKCASWGISFSLNKDILWSLSFIYTNKIWVCYNHRSSLGPLSTTAEATEVKGLAKATPPPEYRGWCDTGICPFSILAN